MTIYIVLITAIISIIAFQQKSVYSRFLFNPYMVSRYNEWYRFLTSGFIHADWLHLLLNMFVLYQFGTQVEFMYDHIFEAKGWFYYLILYLGGILIAIAPTYQKHKNNPGYNGLGASGAVSAVLFTSILFDPLQKLYLFGVLGMPGIVFGLAYLAYSYYMNRKGQDNVNHDAHFWGAIFGVVYTLILSPNMALHFWYQLTGKY